MQQPSNTELILIRITGEDRPGLTASVTEILAQYDATILDIGQADIHNTLSLGILCKTEEQHSGFIMKELLFKASSLGVTVRFYPVTTKEYEDWVSLQGKNRYILTLLGRKLSARQISATTRILAEQGMNIDAIKRLTGRIPLNECESRTKACIEFSVRGTPKDRAQMQAQLMKLATELEMDFSFQLDNMYRRMRRLICFDMDSTLIETEVIDELAMRAGVGDEVKAITESAMRGEIDFTESFTRRVALLKGLDVSVMKEIAENLPITEGVDRLMFVLKAKEIWYRLCLRQRAGNRKRQTDRTLCGRRSGRKAESRIAAPNCPSRKGRHRADHCRRRRCQRPAHAGRGRLGHCFPCQAQSGGQCQTIHQHHRSGRRALFPRVQRLVH